MPFDLTGSVAVVTGALGRLGPVWCRALLEAGARVLALDLERAQVGKPFQELESRFGANLALWRADVLDRPGMDAVRRRCEAELGVADVLVNNAGIDQPPGPAKTYAIEDVPAQLIESVLQVNLLGAIQASQVFGPAMVDRRCGSIINIGSLYASVSPDARFYDHLPTNPAFLKPIAYGASKAALINVTRYLATHWGASGVRVNALSPGGVRGDQDAEFTRKFNERVPLGRMATEADLGGPLVFLASTAASYVTGTELRVDGGFTAW